MSHKLLVAVEGGANSVFTVVYAAQACAGGQDPERGGMVIFHVLPPLPPSVESGDAAVTRELARRFDAENRNAATLRLKQLRNQAIQQGAEPELVRTAVAENGEGVLDQILRAATIHGCDTIVVGRRGQSLIKEFLAGSVMERLVWKPLGFAVWIVEHPRSGEAL